MFTILILLGSIAFLLCLIAVVRLSAFIALALTAIMVGLVKGMPLDQLAKSLQNGIGSTLGGLVFVLGFGVMLGAILAETGAAQRISDSLIKLIGPNRAKYALAITAFLVGLAMFYNAGFVVLIPLVFVVAERTGLPLVYLGIAMAAALSVTHGFLPPHPGPTAICQIFKADVGRTLVLGMVVAMPALLIAGVIFPEFIRKIKANPPAGLVDVKMKSEAELPPFFTSFFVALSPVLLMAAASIAEFKLEEGSPLLVFLKFIGDPSISMLIGALLGLLLLCKAPRSLETYGKSFENLVNKSTSALTAATMILLIIAAGGAFKQVLVDSGIGEDIANLVEGSPIPPLVLGWLVATLVRVSIGSATVAGLTAAGIVQPILAANPGVSPELMALSIGAGSLMCSHVNDTGFWMFKEYFGLSLGDTFRTWTIMETLVGTSGLIGVLILDALM
jgi:Gnt-I system high-affinity gluconate transporter